MNHLIPIGKMASANRVTIATLRLYDQMGLLKPAYTDPDSGYQSEWENLGFQSGDESEHLVLPFIFA